MMSFSATAWATRLNLRTANILSGRCLSVWLLALLSIAQANAAVSSSQLKLGTTSLETTSLEAMAEKADSIALVTVTRVHPLINQAMTMPGMLAVEAYAYQVGVDRLWKGAQPRALLVRLRDCTTRLKSGERYLVFGSWGINGNWQVNQCQQVMPERQADEPMAQLNRLYGHKVALQ